MSRPFVVAVASGKGGTGKTTVAAHLAIALAKSQATVLVDLDVEAPDALGYFPEARAVGEVESAVVAVPALVPGRCTGCGLCARVCRFGALVFIGGVVTIDGAVCKGCGRCTSVCPAGALVEKPVTVGTVSRYRAGDLELVEGRLAVGDIRATSVIEAAKRASEAEGDVHVRDCPPGVTCPTVHALAGADYVVLVAEPTAFSLHDLSAAVLLVQSRGIPSGIVVNKDGFGAADVDGFAARQGIPVIGRIPFSRARASSGARGRLWEDDAQAARKIEGLAERIRKNRRMGGESRSR